MQGIWRKKFPPKRGITHTFMFHSKLAVQSGCVLSSYRLKFLLGQTGAIFLNLVINHLHVLISLFYTHGVNCKSLFCTNLHFYIFIIYFM